MAILTLQESLATTDELFKLAARRDLCNVDFTSSTGTERPIRALARDELALAKLKKFLKRIPEDLSSLVFVHDKLTGVSYAPPQDVLQARGIQL